MFGMNDSGKSNFLLALRLAFGNGMINEKDVFCSQSTPYDTIRVVTIDVKFIPVDDAGKRTDTFNELWGLHLGNCAMTDSEEKEFFAFRTEFTYDADKEEYVRDRLIVNQWDDNGVVTGNLLGYKIISAFEFIYLDAQRDMATEIRDKNSIWSRQISKIKISQDAKVEIEAALGTLSDRILEESPFLQQVSTDLSLATNIEDSIVEVNPVTRSVDELYKGLDIFVSQNASVPIPISNLGLGTRSRAVFASLKTIVNNKIDNANETPYFCMIAFEEPESHIHPHSQRKLVNEFCSIRGQRIATTHSPYILSTSDLNSLTYVVLRSAETHFSHLSNLELTNDELRRVERFVLNTRGEMLFSRVAVLAEGETEEQALQVFFEEYFGYAPFELGVSIVGVGGKNYLPFLRVIESIGSGWCIFSDGEASAINDIQVAMKNLYCLLDKPDLSIYENIIVLGDSNDFESYLLATGYIDEIIAAINDYEKIDDKSDELHLDHYVKRHNGESTKAHKTDKVCDKCGQNIWEGSFRDYYSEGGKARAVSDCMSSAKTKYAVPIAKKICSSLQDERKYPPKILALLKQIKKLLEN